MSFLPRTLTVAAFTSFGFAATVAAAADFASNEDITAAMSERTYLGGMLTGTFAEFYAADGTIKGDGYGGKWRVAENEMCFQYGTDPEGCWQLKIEGDAVTLFKDGKVDGSGVTVPGNPNNF